MVSTPSFGYWLRRRRRALDLTQAGLAVQVGCATVTIRKMEADEFRPSLPMAERLADCLSLSPDERHSFLQAARQVRSPEQLPLPVRPLNRVPIGASKHPTGPAPPVLAGETTVSPVEFLLDRMLLAEREEELTFLQAQYDEVAAQSSGRLILLEGGPGTGKTRLARALGSYARRRGAVYLEGRYLREDGTGLYSPWIDALGSGLQGSPPEEATELVNLHREVVALLQEVRRDSGRLSGPAQAGREEENTRLDDGICRLVTALAESAPLVLFLDDLQWAPGLSLLARVARSLQGVPALVIGAYREQELHERPSLAGDWADLYQSRLFALLPLQPLTEEQTLRGLAGAFGEEGAIELGKAVHGLSCGYPVRIAEILRALLERRLIHPGEGRWEVSRPVDVDWIQVVGLVGEVEGLEEEVPGALVQGFRGEEASWTNPFIAGPPIAEPHRFFGRQREVRRLFGLWQHPPFQNAAIIGRPRSGKTSLLRYLSTVTTTPAEQLRPGQRDAGLATPERYRWVFVDFQDPRLRSQDGLLRHLLAGLKLPVPSACSLSQFMEICSRGIRNPAIILLDNIHAALDDGGSTLDTDFWEGLRSLATNHVGGNLGFALASHLPPDQFAQSSGLSSPFFNIFGYTTQLGPLTEPEARELIASSPAPFFPDDVEWILDRSGRWPILLQILCRERLVALEHGETDVGWQDEALRQMMPFRQLLA